MSKTKEGICKLCGELKPLTFEHVPPEKAFNSFSVMEYSSDTALSVMAGSAGHMPWDFSGFSGKINQRGGGDYYLCRDCNSKTGSWYINEYVSLANTFHKMISEKHYTPNSLLFFRLFDFYPLRIIKAIMTMYCDINHNCFGDDSLRRFLLEKESNELDTDKYSIYMYLASPSMRRIQSLSAMYITNIGIVTLSEIGSYPIGTILCIDKPKAYIPPGLDISGFAHSTYDETWTSDFIGMPYYEINSLFPTDFRTKEEFRTIMKNHTESAE